MCSAHKLATPFSLFVLHMDSGCSRCERPGACHGGVTPCLHGGGTATHEDGGVPSSKRPCRPGGEADTGGRQGLFVACHGAEGRYPHAVVVEVHTPHLTLQTTNSNGI